MPFYLLDVPVDLVADHTKLIIAVRSQVNGQRPAVVVIDTLNRALIGDENKSDDMAKFIRAADTVRVAFECTVVIVHHCGVQGGRPRGHTSLSGADDVQIAVNRDKDGNIIASVEHMKDGEAGAVIACKLEHVELDRDEDGDPISSCIIVPAEGVASASAKDKGPKLSDTNKLGLSLLRELIASAGKPPPAEAHLSLPANTLVCSATEWRERFYNGYPSDSQTTKQKAFVRVQLKLMELKLIDVFSIYVWLKTDPDKPDI